MAVGVIRLPAEEAAKIESDTAPDKELEGYYAYAIEMWHELHCLVCMNTGEYTSRC
jgi:hypothetical protein